MHLDLQQSQPEPDSFGHGGEEEPGVDPEAKVGPN